MWLEHAQAEPRMLNYDYIANEDVESYLRDCMADPRQAFFVAVDGETVVGTARASIKPVDELGMYNFDRYVYFDDLAVTPDYRRQGIAARLTDARINFAQEQGIHVCQSKVYQYNRAGRAAAESAGFEPAYTYYYKYLEAARG